MGLRAGKVPNPLLRELLGDPADWPRELLLGPRPGEDACAIEVPGGVLVAATDPITLVGRGVGAHAVVINANDVAVMGVRPRWFLAAVLVPEGSEEADLRALFAGMQARLDQIGAVLVGGHTEVTPVVRQPVVVGQMLGLAADGRFLRTGDARPGDAVVQVGPAPVEGAAVLVAARGAALESVDAASLERARGALEDPGISVVEAALRARDLGARALHDPTEGGLAAGLHEIAEASGVGLRVDPAAFLWFEPGVRVCRALGADPVATLASGALLAVFAPDEAEAAVRGLRAEGWTARILGEAIPGSGVSDPTGHPLPCPERDEVARLLATP